MSRERQQLEAVEAVEAAACARVDLLDARCAHPAATIAYGPPSRSARGSADGGGRSRDHEQIGRAPPDQRAALSLLLRQRKSYAEVAALLEHRRARRARPRARRARRCSRPRQARELAPERRARRSATTCSASSRASPSACARAPTSAAPRRRARGRGALAAELAPLARRRAAGDPRRRRAAAATGPRPAPAREPERASAPTRRRSRLERRERVSASAPRSLPSSRLGGALLLAAIVAAVVVAVILITAGGGSSQDIPPTASEHDGRQRQDRTGGRTAPLTLKPASRSSGSIGVVEVLSEGGKHAFYIEAADTSRRSHGFFYAIWLYNSPTSALRAQQEPGRSARPSASPAARCCPQTPANIHEMLLTRETSRHPTQPGPRRAAAAPFSRRQRAERREQLAGVHDPGRVELGLQRAQRRARRSLPTSRSIHGAWSRPTAWWWVIVPPPSTIASPAARLTVAPLLDLGRPRAGGRGT